ncbi:tetratricopeptide repeat protein [bacterium]|nr:tetratricopeptide repeat protein [bacterium]
MKKTLAIVSISLALVACSDKKAELKSEIDALGAAEYQDGETKRELCEKQTDYINAFPKDSASEFYMESVALYLNRVDSFETSQTYTERYIETYPSAQNLVEMKLLRARNYVGMQKADSAYYVYDDVVSETILSNDDLRKLKAVLLELSEDESRDDQDVMLFKLGGVTEEILGFADAAKVYADLYTRFPESKYAAFGMMKHGDMMERQQQIDSAKAVYTALIKRYPESKHAADAKVMMETDVIGLSAEEQLQKILEAKANQ